MADICGDNRFELIEKYRNKLIKATNIEDSPEETARQIKIFKKEVCGE